MTLDPIRKSKPALARSVKSTCLSFWESLEVRQLLSGSIAPAISLDYVIPDAKTGSTVQGYTPAQIRSAYGFTGVSENGSGQTIAIVDAYNDPNITADLVKFDTQFGLAAPPSFKVVSQTGSSKLPSTDAGWAQEISLDVEWAHAIAPDANILLVEASSDSTKNLIASVNYARSAAGVSVVSMSWGGSELSNETSYDKDFTTPSGHIGVTFVAAAGDEGAAGGAEWPAASPNVVSVGGTSLTLSGSTYSSETTWDETSDGTSEYESTPGYQSALGVSGRTTADVSYDADPNTGFATYDSLSYEGEVGWAETGGTSAGTPQWSALFALADQGRVAAGHGTLDGATQSLPALYGIYANATTYAADFNDITTGSNGSDDDGGFGGGGAGGGFGGGGFGGGGFGGGGFGGGGFGGFGGHHGRGYASLIAQEEEAASTSTGVSLTSATTGYDGPTGLGTPKAAGLVGSLISYGITASIKPASVSKSVSPSIERFTPALRIEQPPAPTPTAYAVVNTSSSKTVLNRPEPQVDSDTAVGLARPSASAAATADSLSLASQGNGLGTMSGYLTATQPAQWLLKIADAIEPAVLSNVVSTASAASQLLADARNDAVDAAASTASLLIAPEHAIMMARIDANATFDDAVTALTDELAASPAVAGTVHSNAKAWIVTGIVIAADAVLLARYKLKRPAHFSDKIAIAV